MKIYSYLDVVYLGSVLTSIRYVEEIIFELISQENDITLFSLLCFRFILRSFPGQGQYKF